MAISVAARKAKGRKLQKIVVDAILNIFPGLTKRDVKSTSMGKSGEDVELSEAASKLFPFSVEAKWHENLNIWSALEQAESQNRELIPLAVFKRNGSKVFCALEFETFMKILQRYYESAENMDRLGDKL